MEIKELEKKDLTDVFDLVVQLAKETKFYTPDIKHFMGSWNKFLSNGNGVILGAFVRNELVGIMDGIVSRDTNTGIMTASEMHFYVRPEHRRMGIGGWLYTKFVEWAKEKECKLIGFSHPSKEKWMKQIFKDLRPIETYYLKEI